MAYCPKCGVEVETNRCPLCSHVILKDIHRVPFSHSVNVEKRHIFLSNSAKKAIFNASSIFLAVLISAICLTIDVVFDKKISWSIYPIIPVITIALITTVSIYVKGILKPIGILILFLGMLFFLDMTIPVQSFFLKISLPISILLSLISLGVVVLINKSKTKGANVPAYILIGLAFYTIVIDMVINNYLHGSLNIGWSLITTVTLVPISIFLLYIHYILSKRIDLSKVFHT